MEKFTEYTGERMSTKAAKGTNLFFVLSVSSVERGRSRFTELDLYADDGYLL